MTGRPRAARGVGRGCGMHPRPFRSDGGYSLVEIIFVAALIAIMSAIAVPQTLATVHQSRALAAARYLAGQMALARGRAVARSTTVALRFESIGADYTVAVYTDGNRNGVRTVDIQKGVDLPLEAPARLSQFFPQVIIALSEGGSGPDPVKIGNTTLMSFTPAGTATSGTIYIRGFDGSQFAVRVLGVTGRTRLLRRLSDGTWVDQR